MTEMESNKGRNAEEASSPVSPGQVSKAPNNVEAKPKASNIADEKASKSPWDQSDGEASEVIDSEGHRNHINRY